MAVETFVTKKSGKGGVVEWEVSNTCDFDKLYDEAPDDVKKSNSIANMKVTWRGRVKSLVKQGFKDEALQAELDKWRPGVASPRGAVDVEAAYMAKYRAMTPEQKKAEIAKLKGM